MINYVRHDEEFHFLVKLVSGETIIGKGFATEDEGASVIYVQNPVEISVVTKSLGEGRGLKGVSMNKWMEFSSEDFYIINEKDIMTMGGLSQEMTFMYELFIKKDREKEDVEATIEEAKLPLDKEMGHKGKIAEIKRKLEKIFKTL